MTLKYEHTSHYKQTDSKHRLSRNRFSDAILNFILIKFRKVRCCLVTEKFTNIKFCRKYVCKSFGFNIEFFLVVPACLLYFDFRILCVTLRLIHRIRIIPPLPSNFLSPHPPTQPAHQPPPKYQK